MLYTRVLTVICSEITQGQDPARPCGSIARVGESYHRPSRCLTIAGCPGSSP
jgi:hypothetical protein